MWQLPTRSVEIGMLFAPLMPPEAAGLADRPWHIAEIVELIAARERASN